METAGRNSKLALGAASTVIVFAISSYWAYQAWSAASKTVNWPAVSATVTGNSTSGGGRRQVEHLTTIVVYTYGDQEYQAELDAYALENLEIYVDPNDPTNVRLDRGVTAKDVAYPIAGMVLSALFAIFLVMVLFSPSDD